LVATHQGDDALWAPYCDGEGLVVAVAGRPAFDASEWDAARTSDRPGGLAAIAIASRVRASGPGALESLNGNFAAVVADVPAQRIYLVTDPCGVMPVFEVATPHGRVYGSHPDILADVAGERHRLDEVSLAEFVLFSSVSAPFSYYERVRSVDCGTVVTLDLRDANAVPLRRKYFEFDFRGDSHVSERELATQLAWAIGVAVRRRTQDHLGPTAIALSGGLDSRVILAASKNNADIFSFCCYDQPNRELRIAAALADAESVRFLPLRRSVDYYAEHAEAGVRISGGMGSLANNHFLGVIPQLVDQGMQTVLTGCYCDYLFKGLPLNRRTHWLTGRETLAPYRNSFYFDHTASTTQLATAATRRMADRVPSEEQRQHSESAVLRVEARRTFPLFYEGDNQQRLVPQRLTGWCPPFVDRDVLDVYRRIPYKFKLNRSLFKKTAAIAAPELASITDANTGATPVASRTWERVRSQQVRFERMWRRMSGTVSSEESWPVWEHYVSHSPGLDAMWKRPNADASDLFRRVLGPSPLLNDIPRMKREQPFLFVGLLTLKLWLDQRL